MTTQSIKLPYKFHWSNDLPHVALVDLFDNDIGVEVVVMTIDQVTGDLYYIRIDHMDDIDRRRMLQILEGNNAKTNPLYDLLFYRTLPNGKNALEFFEQFVMVKTVKNQHFKSNMQRRTFGFAGGYQQTVAAEQPQLAPVQSVTGESTAPVRLSGEYTPPSVALGAEETATAVKRGPGRPSSK